MDEFYQELRKVQKKERNNATLARVDEDFYTRIHEYMDKLKKEAITDPFSKNLALLKQSQIIATEICGRREKKITEAAVVNIQRSYHLFTGKPQFDLVDTTPLNLTPEEEQFYFSIIDTLRNHRSNISLETLSDDEDDEVIIRPEEPQKNTLIPPKETKSDDEVLNRLDEIAKAKPIVDEKPKTVVKPKTVEKPKTIEKPIEEPKVEPVKRPQNRNIEENPNAFDGSEEFYDLESKRIAKEAELVTMLVFDEVGPIVGVDEKVYGPFRPQDLVTLPLINAKIFFKNRKGRQVKI